MAQKVLDCTRPFIFIISAGNLFLGVALLIQEKLRNNNSGFFRRITSAWRQLEDWLIGNKSLIDILVQNMNRKQRVPKFAICLIS